MKEIRLPLTQGELMELCNQAGDFKEVIFLQDNTKSIVEHRNESMKLCQAFLGMFEVKNSSTRKHKFGLMGVCPCGTLFVSSDIQEVK